MLGDVLGGLGASGEEHVLILKTKIGGSLTLCGSDQSGLIAKRRRMYYRQLSINSPPFSVNNTLSKLEVVILTLRLKFPKEEWVWLLPNRWVFATPHVREESDIEETILVVAVEEIWFLIGLVVPELLEVLAHRLQLLKRI